MKGGERVDQKKNPGKPARTPRKSPLKSRKTDPLGSYTGVPAGDGERPQQDADDL